MNWAEQKQAGKTPAHAAVIANNTLAILGSKKNMIPYKGSVEMVLLTNGKVRFLLLWKLASSEYLVGYFSPLVLVTLQCYGGSSLEVGLLKS